jgi:DNA-binding transcriptional MerR regulator
MSLLKVGELARHSGLTIRTLHHYDEIGLLKPSARSDGGYRLYDGADVARLHGIQALRRLGLTLAEIGELLSRDGASLPAIIERQLQSLDREIAQASELRARLTLVQAAMASGSAPGIDDWLGTLSLMSTYGKYFDTEELRVILGNLKRLANEWSPLVAKVREQMALDAPPDAVAVQRLAREWMDLAIRWMDGDMDRLMRWGQMYRQESIARGRHGIDLDVMDYIGRAIEMRLAAMRKYLSDDDMVRIDKTLAPEWRELAADVAQLIERGSDVHCDDAHALAARWDALCERMVRGDAGLRQRMVQAFESEPLLRDAGMLSGDARQFLRGAFESMRAAHDLDRQAA